MVLVYSSATAAQAARLQAGVHEQALAGNSMSSPGPHLVYGYGPSVWNHNVAMVQTMLADLERDYQVQNDRDCGINVDLHPLRDRVQPKMAVDIDFQQALQNGDPNRKE
jgi:hypothetical protein